MEKIKYFRSGDAPVKPEKDIPAKPDPNPDPTKPRPGGNEPQKNDPTRITTPPKTDPTRIDPNPQPKTKIKGMGFDIVYFPLPAA